MAERYEDIIGPGGQVVGQRLVSDASAPRVTIFKADLLGRMTPLEVHAWIRAAQIARDTTKTSTVPTTAQINALYAWERFQAFGLHLDLTSADLQGLKAVWVALGMTQARADELLTPAA